MDKLLPNLSTQFDAQDIENALVQLFVERHNIVVQHNVLIKTILEDHSESVASVKQELRTSFQSEQISDFVNMFELLVPSEDKKINGAFFTPKLVTEYMVSESVTRRDEKVCDPSCGCGAFLIETARFMSERFGISIIETIERNLYGVDIAEYSIRRAKILLTLLALQRGEDRTEIAFHLKTADSLSCDWVKLFATKFDVVIGNPPYVKFQDLSDALRKQLNVDWQTLTKGNFNLYFAFFEQGINIMKKDGVLAYITPNTYFTSLAGAPLREYLVRHKLISRILDFNHLKLFQAQTYTCITFLRWGDKASFEYEKIDDYASLETLGSATYSTISFSDLNNRKWRLLRREDQANIRHIETIGQKLGDVVDIRVGIATCKDAVYFIDGDTLEDGFYHKTYKGMDYTIEAGVTKPIAKISDFKDQHEVVSNSRRIIFPYRKDNGKVEILEETELKARYPHCYAYLLAARTELATRDKGNGKYPAWYAYARTQGLNFFGEKLLTPTFSAEPRFLLEKDEEGLFCNGYAVYSKEKPDIPQTNHTTLSLDAIGKILNSRVMDYYVKRTSVSIDGGYPCYQKNFIELFGIPNFSQEDIAYLESTQDKEALDTFLINKYNVTI